MWARAMFGAFGEDRGESVKETGEIPDAIQFQMQREDVMKQDGAG